MALINSSILITGSTGSFGHTFVPMTLAKDNPKRLVMLSRDEMKKWEMAKLFQDDLRVRFLLVSSLCRAIARTPMVVRHAWLWCATVMSWVRAAR